MNLRHVNIVSQSYIGNTALLYTSKTKTGCSHPGAEAPAAAAPAAAPRRGAGCRWCPRLRAALDRETACASARLFVKRRKRSSAGERARSLPSGRPAPRGLPLVMLLPKTTIKGKRNPHEKAPPKPLKKPQT